MFNLDSASVANRPVLDDTAALVVATPPTHAPHNVVSPRTRLTDGRSFFEWLSDDVSFQYLYQLWYQNQLERRQLAVAVLAVQETTAVSLKPHSTIPYHTIHVHRVRCPLTIHRNLFSEPNSNS